MKNFTNQGHMEDVLLWHRYNYYVLGCGIVPDALYDRMERELCARWPINGIASTVGSDDWQDYPAYIQEGRRPGPEERKARDWTIMQRWVREL